MAAKIAQIMPAPAGDVVVIETSDNVDEYPVYCYALTTEGLVCPVIENVLNQDDGLLVVLTPDEMPGGCRIERTA